MSDQPIRIDYFSDVLCVWAYTAQIRMDELRQQYGGQVELQHHFIPVFGCTRHMIGDGWKARGGFAGYSEHVRKICADFPHVQVHPEIWTRAIPASSASAHLFLKAIALLDPDNNPERVEAAAWALRVAFFRDMRDIARRACQLEIAAELGLPVADLIELLDSGQAMASLCDDLELRDRYRIEGSPTYVLNEGRQKLYGNIGYKIIQANIEELLHRPSGQASWC